METSTLTPETGNGTCRHRHSPSARLGRIVVVLAVAAAAGFAGGYAGKSYAQGPHGFWKAAMDPARVDDRVERMVRHLAAEVDATPEQRDKLNGIAKSAARDLLPLREKMRTARTQAVALVAAPQIDRAAIEKLRVEQVALADGTSKRIMDALAEAADVLTPEQRGKLAEHARRMGERRSWGRS
ncbi:MAG: Spy/CpxP family protein refolding chaperone [Burkholderiales bacterium]|nr:Spy/CpxP family protein refolding chaperone [Burkholderiales bacterium]